MFLVNAARLAHFGVGRYGKHLRTGDSPEGEKMAYRIYKKAAETEELQLFDESGQLSKTITVRLDRDGLAQKLSSSHTALLRAR